MTNLANTQITMNNLSRNIEEQNRLKSESIFNQLSKLRREFTNLINQLSTWEQDFVLKTPISGQVTFTNFWSVNQFVKTGKWFLRLYLISEQKIIGKANFPIAGAGKVEKMQRVNVKLDNYPYMEFGIARR